MSSFLDSIDGWEKKCWGSVKHLFCNPNAAVSLLQIKEGFQCSVHWHRRRANLFVLLSGVVVIETWDDKSIKDEPNRFLLLPGHSFLVPSNMIHRFVVEESGWMVEVYWPDGVVEQDDIVRLSTGGPAAKK